MRAPIGLPTQTPMSPTQVAQATNTSRRTVMRAIEAKDLQAFRDNRNHWKITRQAVEEWALAQCAPSGQVLPMPFSEPLSAHPLPTSKEGSEVLEAERQARRLAEVEAAELRGRLAATEAERDKLYSIIQHLTSSRTTAEERPRRRWWPWKK